MKTRHSHLIAALLLSLLPLQSVAEQRIANNSDAEIRVIANDLSSNDQQKIHQWLSKLVGSIEYTFGKFPLERANFNVRTTRSSREPIPWGQIKRRGTEGIHFVVDPSYPLKRFNQDWTGYHEIAHLMIPYPGDEDLWLSEGLASYWQQFLRYNAGVLTEQQAWQALYAGFQRGERDTRYSSIPLYRLSDDMHSKRSYMRVYWSGAAFWLEAEYLMLSQQHTSVVTRLANAYRPYRTQSFTSGERVIRALSGEQWPQLSRLYRKWQESHGLQMPLKALDWFGVKVQKGKVRLNPNSPFPERRQLAYRAAPSDNRN
ncbi:hypothetical protein [Paraferrimonas sedimenticola]|uniref:Peptidase M61 catalytic domain-containing protein n=1 Tax=Paraferrimonas sedimenticola TaxID=375674 RepID=A0AA37W0W0_9GAMM|nr:hypothetical protein [Paraferrimonas sedimenticola]GLP96118.1 hypothetical protein GCM10007895_14240 [Paraferrimonas sedimenticola]